MTTKLKPFNLYVPITRMEKTPDGLLVEGYCYANAKCAGDRWNLTRAAMESAAADYMRWGAVREMHQMKAVGTAVSLEFDDKGGFLRSLVVDKDAIEKCEKGVLKGYSVGVKPQVVRGSDIQTCIWPETSLVDRPVDPDSAFKIVRADGYDPDEEYDVEVLEDEPEVLRIEATDPNPEAVTVAEVAALIVETPPVEAPVIEVRADGITSETAPARENLEGKVPKGVMHYDCGLWASRADEGTNLALTGNLTDSGAFCHVHTTPEGATACREGQSNKPLDELLAWHQGEARRFDERAEADFEVLRASDDDGSKPYGDVSYADPGYQSDGQHRYPIDTADHVRAAWSYINQEKNAGKYSSEDLAKVKGRIKSAAKNLGVEISAEETNRADEPAVLRAELETTIQRAEAAETELARVQTELLSRSDELTAKGMELASAIERTAVLEAEPATRPRPVKYPAALERTFAANLSRTEQDELTGTLRQEYESLKTSLDPKNEPDPQKRAAGVVTMMNLKTALAEMGVAV